MRHFSFRPAITLKGRKNKGLRGLAGKPLHPPLTDVPVTAYLFAAVFDVLSIAVHSSHPIVARQLFVAGTWTALGGAAVSLLTALTGTIDWLTCADPRTPSKARRVPSAGEKTYPSVGPDGTPAAGLASAESAPITSVPALIVVLSVISAALVTLGAWYGGTLVFDYGFNVETAGDHPVWHKSETDVFPGEKH